MPQSDQTICLTVMRWRVRNCIGRVDEAEMRVQMRVKE